MRGVRSGRLCYLRISVSRKTLSPPSSEFLCLRFLLALLTLRVMLPLRATVPPPSYLPITVSTVALFLSVSLISVTWGKRLIAVVKNKKRALIFPEDFLLGGIQGLRSECQTRLGPHLYPPNGVMRWSYVLAMPLQCAVNV